MRPVFARGALFAVSALLALALCGGCGGQVRTAGPTTTGPSGTARTGAATTTPAGPSRPTPSGTTTTPPRTGTGPAAPPTTPPRTTQFTGHYLGGARSSFVPCGSSAPPDYDQGWWLVADPQSGFTQRYRSLVGALATATDSPGTATTGRPVYVRFSGTLEQGAAQGYGPQHTYRKQVTVHTLQEMSTDGRCPGNQGAPPS